MYMFGVPKIGDIGGYEVNECSSEALLSFNAFITVYLGTNRV